MKNFKKVGVVMGNAGRPKLEIARTERLGLRLTKFELEKISRVAEKIDLLERDKPKKFKNLSGNNKKISDGVIDGEVVMFNK